MKKRRVKFNVKRYGKILLLFLARVHCGLGTFDACFFCSEMPYPSCRAFFLCWATRRDATRSLLGFMTSAGPLGDNAKSQQKYSHLVHFF